MPSVLNLFQTFKFKKTIFIPQKFLFLRSSVPPISKNTLHITEKEEEGRIEKKQQQEVL